MNDQAAPADGSVRTTAPRQRPRVSSEEAAERLIETTIDMLREVPFTELSVRTITARADLNKSTIERCFGSIENLFSEASQRLTAESVARLAESPDAAPFADPDLALATRFRAWLVTGGVDGSVFRPSNDDPTAEALITRQRRIAGVSPLSSQIFHYATSLMVEGFLVFDETRRTNDEIRLNLLLLMNEFINQLPNIDAALGWTGRSAIDVDIDEHPDAQ
jgi:AcrR family transcriptional regulator